MTIFAMHVTKNYFSSETEIRQASKLEIFDITGILGGLLNIFQLLAIEKV